MSKEIRNAITEICQGIVYNVVYIGKQNREGWECDAFNLILGGESFEYAQGIGHSCTVYDKRAKPFEERLKGERFKKKSIKEGFEVFIDNQRDANARYIKKPHLADLLYSIITDSSISSESFEDFCGNCGYDTDSRKALETYLKCQQNSSKLSKVLRHEKWVRCQELLQEY